MGDWAYQDYSLCSLTGGLASNAYAVTVTGSNTANLKGGWSPLATTTSIAASGMLISIGNASAAAKFLVEIGTGPSGSETQLVPNIMYQAPRANQGRACFFLPVGLPTNSRVAVRARANVAAAACNAQLWLMGGGFGSPHVFASVSSFGEARLTSGGTTIDPGATVHTKGAWNQLVSTTGANISWLTIIAGYRANTALDSPCSWCVDIGVGPAGQETVIIPDLVFQGNVTNDDIEPTAISFPFSIPKGVTLSARAKNALNTAADRVIDVMLYGVS